MFIFFQIFAEAKLLDPDQWNFYMKNRSLRALWIYFQNCFIIFRSRMTSFSYISFGVKHPVSLLKWTLASGYGYPAIMLSLVKSSSHSFVKRATDQLYSPTVWLFSFVTFHDDIILKVIEIIEFWKKFLKDYENTFYNISIKGST